jgi:hypothetical protein
MGPFIRMPQTMSKHKVKTVTCVFTCMEDISDKYINQQNAWEGQRQLPKQVLRYNEMMNITKYHFIRFSNKKITTESTERFILFPSKYILHNTWKKKTCMKKMNKQLTSWWIFLKVMTITSTYWWCVHIFMHTPLSYLWFKDWQTMSYLWFYSICSCPIKNLTQWFQLLQQSDSGFKNSRHFILHDQMHKNPCTWCFMFLNLRWTQLLKLCTERQVNY